MGARLKATRLSFLSTVSSYLVAVLFILLQATVHAAFTTFDSGQVRPLAMSSSGDRLYVVNTPDNQLEVFSVNSFGLTYSTSVPVGLEPVAVALRNDNEVWVVNYLSDSITIIDVSLSPPRVTRTLLVGDEPADIVFAGPGGNRAFITTAHRGQNSPWCVDSSNPKCVNPTNPGQAITPGVGRADVWVFNAADQGPALGGTPETFVTLFGDTPKALTVSPDGNTVYAAIFKSGNQTTTINEGAVCKGGASAGSCTVADALSPGGLPAPNQSSAGDPAPDTGLIVKYNGSSWRDELGRDWSGLVRFNLPDKDVFAIDATANPPVEIASFSGVGTVLFNMAVNPASGKVYVANTEAINEVRFEGTRTVTNASTVTGHLHEARITVINPGTSSVTPRHLNKHINYSIVPSLPGVSDNSLATPKGMAVTSDGNTLYVVAKGSGKIGVFDTSELENNTFVPDTANHIQLSAGGPDGLVLDETNKRLYVTTRFDNGVSVIDTTSNTEISHIGLHNPEPASVIAGRQFLYDAGVSSSNGEASCSSCHIEGDKDELAWDLGDPEGSLINNPLNFVFGTGQPFHPMKGPMTTQTLRGMNTHGSMHWRGDRTTGNDAGGDPFDEVGAFKKFNGAFVGLLGRSAQLGIAEMQAYTDFILQVTMPPNPNRKLTDQLTDDQDAGKTFYLTQVSDLITTCNGCHVLDPPTGAFGTNGSASVEGEPQEFKIAHLRNLYEKVGMFGMPDVQFFNTGNNTHQGDQIRGFGFLHDGSVDTPFRFLNAVLFNFPGGDSQRRDVEQFLLAFDTNLKPVVGQQVTISNSSPSSASTRASLLVARAEAGDCDVIVKGNFGGIQRGGLYIGGGFFQLDGADFPSVNGNDLVTQALIAGSTVTYTAVPPGDGFRIGIDRDDDTLLNEDDNCPLVANLDQANTDIDAVGNACDNCPAVPNSSQLDTDADGSGDACDADDDNDGLSDSLEQAAGSSSILLDTDGDGLTDFEEVAWDGDPNTYIPGADLNPASDDTDSDGLPDPVDPIPLVFNYNDGDVVTDSNVNAGDYLVVMRTVLGLTPVTDHMLAHADLYPDGTPDGLITIQDLILLLQFSLLQKN